MLWKHKEGTCKLFQGIVEGFSAGYNLHDLAPGPWNKATVGTSQGTKDKGMQKSCKSLNSFEKQNRVKTCYSK